MPLDGQQIGRYHIVRLLGSGGMGEVYLAEDASIGQQVAIKVLLSDGALYPNTQAGQDAIRLFQREAKAIVKLDHPNILPLFDFGETQLGGMTLLYLVMPYRPEGSLADWVRNRATEHLLPPPDVAHCIRQAAAALQHAHTRQIIHQDVKPANFLLRQRDEPAALPDLLLADFGIARFATATASVSQVVRGTPTYMAPEQWQGEAVPATDQYALAIMAYELLTGRPPFQGNSMRLMHDHLQATPPAPSTANPSLPKALDAVLLNALAKAPSQRFGSISAFANDFEQATQSAAPVPIMAIPIEQAPPPAWSAPTTPAARGDINNAPTRVSNPLSNTISDATTKSSQPLPAPIGMAWKPAQKNAALVNSVPKPGAGGSRLLKSWKGRATLAVLVALLLLVCGMGGYLATVGITVKETYTLTTAPGAVNQVSGGLLSIDSDTYTEIALSTGEMASNAQSHGILTLSNDTFAPISLPKGLVIDNNEDRCSSSVHMVFDAPVTIPEGFDVATVSAHVQE